VQDNKIKVLVQSEPKSKELADVPSVQELARNETDRRIMALIVSGDALGKPLATSPNVPIERVQALRDAFDATIKDPAFIEAAAAARVEITPIYGLALQATVKSVLATPKNLADRAKMIIAE
jgi:tripartite-type tricarboxylate transporter receptor subunit TctC